MGFTNRNKNWVGNIYSKFDDFITKGTVNYVGNQVQTVGGNVKRFYSDVVQDYLPPLNPVQLKGQATRRNQSNAIAETESSLQNDGDDVICRNSHLNFKESMAMEAQGSHSSDNISSESLRSAIHEVGIAIAQTESSLNNDGDDVICRNSHLNFKESVTMEARGSYSSDNISSESLRSSLHEFEPIIAQKDETLTLDDLDLLLSSQIILKGEVKKVTEESGSDDKNLSEPLMISAVEDYMDPIISKLSPTIQIQPYNADEDGEFIDDETVSSSFSSDSCHVSDESHYQRQLESGSDDKNLSKPLMISAVEDYMDPIISKLSPTMQIQPYNADEDREFIDDETVSSSFSSDSCHVSDESHYRRQLHILHGMTTRLEQSLNVGSDVFSIDQDHKSQVTSVTSLNDPGLGSFHKSALEDELEHGCQLNQLTALVSPVETDPLMETIDISDKEKLDSSCVRVDSNKPLNTVSSGPRRFKSYKKLIQDALASRKKLVTEYKLFGIWYGDIDTESSQNSMDSPTTVPATSLDSKKLQSCKCGESGWELL